MRVIDAAQISEVLDGAAVTIFNDATKPPTLLHENISLGTLAVFGAMLPATYINQRGDIVRLSGEVVMRGNGVAHP